MGLTSEEDRDVLGVENNLVRLSEHNSVWAELYRQEEQRIKAAAGEYIVDLQHIGSTSIPGIKAKPVLDMLAGVRDLEQTLQFKEALETIGYNFIPRAEIATDYVFGKGTPRTHYLHIVKFGDVKWKSHLHFRDRLRTDPELARAYERLKEELSARFSDSQSEYHQGKSQFINEVTAHNLTSDDLK